MVARVRALRHLQNFATGRVLVPQESVGEEGVVLGYQLPQEGLEHRGAGLAELGSPVRM